MSEGEVQLRSFRVVFDLERRIHKIDRYRIPLPYGLPLRSVAYAIGTLAVVAVAQRLPVVGAVCGVLPAPVRFALLPCVVGWALTQLRIDGRVAHVALLAVARYVLAPRRVACCEAASRRIERLGDVAVVGDERAATYRPAVIRGPGPVLLRAAFSVRGRGRTLRVAADGDGHLVSGRRVQLADGQRVVVRCASR